MDWIDPTEPLAFSTATNDAETQDLWLEDGTFTVTIVIREEPADPAET